MAGSDAWIILGLPAGASLADARAARRLLAKRLHPDLYSGDSARERAERSAQMIQVNRALADIEAAGEPGPPATVMSGWRHPGPDQPRPTAEPVDSDSFTVACLPAEAFEALFLIGYALGDIVTAEEPYRLELYLTEPAPCFCRLSLVPEAGGSLVMLDVEGPGDSVAGPDASSVSDVLVAELNRLAPGSRADL